ncbi:ankyrin repeat-containing protein [Fusarium sp. NRRL 52700]|nr:ankyrin repeat-containing protein [Fusarium sp. NRRL 52700]
MTTGIGIAFDNFREFLNWVSPSDFTEIHRGIRQRRLADTGKSLLDSEAFGKWLNGSPDFPTTMWCRGTREYRTFMFRYGVANTVEEGVGKTFLMSTVIDRLLNLQNDSRNIGVAFMYCRRDDQNQQSQGNLVSGLLRQLIYYEQNHETSVHEPIRDIWNMYKQGKPRPSLGKITEVLLAQVPKFSKVFIVIDALDECTQEDGIQSSMISTLKMLQRSTSLMVTSRNLELPMELQCSVETHSFTLKRSNEDISAYVKAFLGLRGLKKASLSETIRQDQELLNQIIDKVCVKSDGIIQNQDPLASRRTAVNALLWVSRARRDMTMRELRHAISVLDVPFNNSRLDKHKYLSMQDLEDLCDGLIMLDSDSPEAKVRLFHSSAYDFFLKRPIARASFVERSMVLGCLSYMSVDELKTGSCESDEELEDRLSNYPFLIYAAQHWGDHMRQTSEDEEKVRDSALQFLQHQGRFSTAMQALSVPNFRSPGYSQRYDKTSTSLHVTVSYGLLKLSENLVKAGADVCSTNDHGRTAMHVAAEKGNTKIVKLLLGTESNIVEAQDREGKIPLHFAALGGHVETLELLIRNGSKVDMSDNHQQTSLHLAALSGHGSIVKTLVNDHDANVMAKDSGGRTALHIACWMGNLGIVQILLPKTSIGIKDENGITPVHLAAGQGHPEIVRLLLESSANALDADTSGWTPIHWACLKRHIITMPWTIDLQQHNDIVPIRSFSTEKNAFSIFGPPESFDQAVSSIAQMTDSLMQGTLVTDQEVQGDAQVVPVSSKPSSLPFVIGFLKPSFPLIPMAMTIRDESRAIKCNTTCGHQDVIRTLLEKTINVNEECKAHFSTSADWATEIRASPLHLAVLSNHHAVAEMLLKDKYVDRDSCRMYGVGPDHVKWHAELTLLQLTMLRGNSHLIQKLLSNDVTDCQDQINSPFLLTLHDQSEDGTVSVWRFKIPPLHFAAFQNDTSDLFKLLLSKKPRVDSKLNASGYYINNSVATTTQTTIDIAPLHLIAIRGTEMGALSMLESFALVNEKCVFYSTAESILQSNTLRAEFTPLHVALVLKRPAMAEFLIQYGADVNTKAWCKSRILVKRQESEFHAEIMPLHIAALYRSDSLTRSILDHGGMVNARSSVSVDIKKHNYNIAINIEATALHFAILGKSEPSARLILEQGAETKCGLLIKVDITTDSICFSLHTELSALHLSAILGDIGVIRSCLPSAQIGALAEIKGTLVLDKDDIRYHCKLNALQLAVLVDRTDDEIFEMLCCPETINAATDIDFRASLQTPHGQNEFSIKGQLTPLHLAVLKRSEVALSALLRLGCYVDTKSALAVHSHGMSPANVASHIQISGMLTPLHLAVFWGTSSIMRILLANGADLQAACDDGRTVNELVRELVVDPAPLSGSQSSLNIDEERGSTSEMSMDPRPRGVINVLRQDGLEGPVPRKCDSSEGIREGVQESPSRDGKSRSTKALHTAEFEGEIRNDIRPKSHTRGGGHKESGVSNTGERNTENRLSGGDIPPISQSREEPVDSGALDSHRSRRRRRKGHRHDHIEGGDSTKSNYRQSNNDRRGSSSKRKDHQASGEGSRGYSASRHRSSESHSRSRAHTSQDKPRRSSSRPRQQGQERTHNHEHMDERESPIERNYITVGKERIVPARYYDVFEGWVRFAAVS